MSDRKILMSAENPDGLKLEDACSIMITEIEAKTAKIASDERSEAQTVRSNNLTIIGHLKTIRLLNEHSMKVLAGIRPDEGPRGKPRIGVGSE